MSLRHHLLLGLAPLLVVVIAASSTASGHAHLDHAEPGPNQVVDTKPEGLHLEFTMAIEVRFSTIALYRFITGADVLPSDLSQPTERELLRLNAAAADLARAVLNNGDAPVPVEEVPIAKDPDSGTSRSLRLDPETALQPGAYVVVWEVLAIDTHWTADHFVFIVAP